MKNKKGIWFLIIFLSIVVVAITSGLIIYLTNPNITFSIYQKSEVLEEKSYTLDEINDIKIDVTSSNIKINKQETSNIVIKITGYKKNQFSLNLKQEELEIKKDKGFLCFGFCTGKEEIEIFLPQDNSISLTLQTTSGKIEIEDFSNSFVTAQTTSGDIYIKNASIMNITSPSGDIQIENISKGSLKSTSGDIKINSYQAEENGSITTTSGDVRIEKVQNAYLEATTKSGDIDIKNQDRFAPYTIFITTMSGDIKG